MADHDGLALQVANGEFVKDWSQLRDDARQDNGSDIFQAQPGVFRQTCQQHSVFIDGFFAVGRNAPASEQSVALQGIEAELDTGVADIDSQKELPVALNGV